MLRKKTPKLRCLSIAMRCCTSEAVTETVHPDPAGTVAKSQTLARRMAQAAARTRRYTCRAPLGRTLNASREMARMTSGRGHTRGKPPLPYAEPKPIGRALAMATNRAASRIMVAKIRGVTRGTWFFGIAGVALVIALVLTAVGIREWWVTVIFMAVIIVFGTLNGITTYRKLKIPPKSTRPPGERRRRVEAHRLLAEQESRPVNDTDAGHITRNRSDS